jgi:dipeptidyl aminopeptidase/acylaminoacyl peptidase
VRIGLALASAGAGTIHLAVLPEHAREWWLFGLFFLGTGGLQPLWALLILLRPSPRLLLAGAVGNAVVIALWVVTRAAGLPFGPDVGEREPAEFIDVLATAYEFLIVVGSLALLLGAPAGDRPLRPAVRALAPSVLAACALALTGAAVGASATGDGHHHTNGHEEHGAGHEEQSDIYLLRMSHRTTTRLTSNDDEQFAFSPAWSPDGRGLAFTQISCDDCAPEIRVLEIDRTRAVRRIRRVVGGSEPSYSPDGRRLAFVGPSGALNAALTDGGGRRRLLATISGSGPVWSPAGTEIAFTATGNDQLTHVFAVPSRGAGLRQLTHGETSEIDPAWSPDGDRLAFARQEPSGRWKIYILRLEAKTATRVTRGAGSDTSPTWSPGGTEIAFVRQTPRDEGSMYVASVATGKARRVAGGQFVVVAPAWSPSDDVIAFVKRPL